MVIYCTAGERDEKLGCQMTQISGSACGRERRQRVNNGCSGTSFEGYFYV
jgi:hypothetical protein